MVVFAFVFRESIVIISAIMCNKIYLNDSLGVSKINKTAFQILYITGQILQFYVRFRIWNNATHRLKLKLHISKELCNDSPSTPLHFHYHESLTVQ